MSDMESALQQAAAEYECGNYAGAFALLLPIAKAGNPVAACRVGTFYQTGLGVPTDAGEAVRWLLASAENVEAPDEVRALAFHNLGTLHVTGGPGLVANPVRAANYFELASRMDGRLGVRSTRSDT